MLGAVEGDKVQLVAGVGAELIAKVKAGELVNFLAAQVGGKGGGRGGALTSCASRASRACTCRSPSWQ